MKRKLVCERFYDFNLMTKSGDSKEIVANAFCNGALVCHQCAPASAMNIREVQ